MTLVHFSYASQKPYIILVSFDGFRWDYLHRGLTPNLERMQRNGVAAFSLQPVFPTKTFPNHLAIVTGMYPENHGIIFNRFRDPFSGKTYSLRDATAVRDPRWYSRRGVLGDCRAAGHRVRQLFLARLGDAAGLPPSDFFREV
ncbi:MAG: alkaline phosphatase family protein [candidate division KSB1 bacterium]|nr:alkaline phosphatase family protein [candidate division KSB1 bacterium]